MLLQAPPLFKGLSGAIRGYGRDISPAAALDLVAGGGNIVIVDIRSDREKENGGVPDLPSGNRSDFCDKSLNSSVLCLFMHVSLFC